MEEIISRALKNADLTGFTEMITGEQGRYVIALTHNKKRSVELLAQQARFYFDSFDNLSVGGRTDPSTGDVIVDIGTTTDDRLQAHMLKKLYRQKCFYDTLVSEDVG